jgi:hypothetical protein
MDIKRITEYIAATIVAGTGIALWLVIPIITGEQAAWDSALYFKAGMPLIMLECTVLGFFFPPRWWQWGLLTALSQAIVMIIKWPTSNLMPPAVLFLFILSAPYFLGGFIGARLKKRIKQNKLSKDMWET